MFSDSHHRCPHVTEQVSQLTEKVSTVTPVLSHVCSCDMGHCTCDDFTCDILEGLFYRRHDTWYMIHDTWWTWWWWYILLNMFNLYADVDARSMTPSRNARSYTLRSVPSSPERSFLLTNYHPHLLYALLLPSRTGNGHGSIVINIWVLRTPAAYLREKWAKYLGIVGDGGSL